jgi:hypothetical protein
MPRSWLNGCKRAVSRRYGNMPYRLRQDKAGKASARCTASGREIPSGGGPNGRRCDGPRRFHA